MELVWENGRIHIRDTLSSRTRLSTTEARTVSFSCSPEENTGRGDDNHEKSRFGKSHQASSSSLETLDRGASGENCQTMDVFCENLRDDVSRWDDYSPVDQKTCLQHDNTPNIDKNIRITDLPKFSPKHRNKPSRSVENGSGWLFGISSASHALSERDLKQPEDSKHFIKLRELESLSEFGNSAQNLISMGELPCARSREKVQELKNKMISMNFSRFSRQAAPVKATVQSTSDRKPKPTAILCPSFSNPERNIDREESPSLLHSYPRSKLQVDPLRKESNSQPSPTEVYGRPSVRTAMKPPSDQQIDDKVSPRPQFEEENNHGQAHDKPVSHQVSAIKGKPGNEKCNDQSYTASSSACSRGASNQPRYTTKRKYHKTSEELTDDDSDDDEIREAQEVKKKTMSARGATGLKRIGTAQVHNLSEKRRRDRINKRMRALQELIPNCKKVDKASVLDDAIEYLKTLQLQLQMMSITKTGLFMPPLLLTTPTPAMQQQMNAHHLAPLTLGIGGASLSSSTSSSGAISGGMGALPANQVLPMFVPPTVFPQFPSLPNEQMIPTNISATNAYRSVFDQLSGFASRLSSNVTTVPFQNFNTNYVNNQNLKC